MARNLPVGLKEVLKSGYAESHSTLQLSLPSDIAPSIDLFFATARLTIDGVVYDRQLRNADAVKTSLTRAADRVTVELQNVDTILGVDLLAVADTLYGANVQFGRYWKDLNSKATFHHIMLTGAVAGVEINENVARLTLISDTYAAVSVGAKEQVIRTCRFQVQGEFRGTACGYTGPKLTCDGLIDSADGCEGRHGTPLKRAKFGGFVYIEGQASVAGAVALPIPASNQLIKLADSSGTVSATNKQQPFIALHEDGYNLTNDDTNLQVRVSPKYSVQAVNAVFDYNAPSDGVTSASSAVASAISAANSTGRPLYFPAGTYLIDEALFTNLNSIKIFGDGPNRSILKSSDSTKAVLNINAAASTSHTITIEDLSIEGAGTGSNNHGIYVHGAQTVYNLTVRNVTIRDCGGRGLYSTDSAFTQYFEGVDVSGCGGNAIEFGSGNTTTLVRCYPHAIATNKAGYRGLYGDITMIGCNGIDSGTNADWGVFGQNTADDGTDTYARVILQGCNVEDFTNRGVYCKTGSFASFFATPILAPASGTVKAIKFDFVDSDSCGIFDALSSIGSKGASWSSSEPVHSSGMPFMQVGHRERATYYDTNVGASTSLPGVTGTLITGSTDYALTFDGWTRFKNPSRIDEVTAPATPPANSIFLYAKDISGTSGLFFKDDAGTEYQLGTGLTGSLTSGRVVYATGSNTVASSAEFLWDNSAKALTASSAGLNAAVYVTDTTNTITARIGTLAGAPDRGIAGTTTNHPFVLYQNNAEAWGVDGNKHWRPYNGSTTQDLGIAAVPIRDVHLGGNVTFYERTAPSTPSANTVVLYAKDKAGTSALYFKNDAGTETEVGAAGAGVTDGDKGDIVVSSSGAVWSFDSGVVSTFARTFLDDADAAAVRATIGAGTGSGTVTSVAQSFTGGLISVSGSPITTSGTLALTVAGTSGGIPYFSSASTWASSAALAANAIVIGGGAGAAPKVTTGLTTDGVSKITLGVAGTSVGSVGFNNATSGSITLTPPTGALGTVTLTMPAETDTLVGRIPFEGYIDGLQMQVVSTTQIAVSAGVAYIQSTGKLLKLTATSTLTPTLAASTWYHLYLYDNGGTPTVESATTAPAAPWYGTARSKTSDTSRRYIGSYKTDANSLIYYFQHTPATGFVQYQEASALAPFRVLGPGQAITVTNVDFSAVVPVTSTLARVRTINYNPSGPAFAVNMASRERFTTLSTGVNATDTTFTVASTSAFPTTADSGNKALGYIDSEFFVWTGKTSTTLTTITRGSPYNPPAAASHSAGATVYAITTIIVNNNTEFPIDYSLSSTQQGAYFLTGNAATSFFGAYWDVQGYTYAR